MIHISRTGIRNLASDDTVYARGVQYYKDNRITNATFSNATKQYRMIVKGNYNYSVIVEEQEDGSFDYNCNCPSRLKDQGACKHVVAALLFILKYQERTMLTETKSPEERKVLQILDYFVAQEDSVLVGETFQLEAIINIPAILKGDNARAAVSLRGGSNRKYKIQTIKKFLADVYHNESFVLGKEFKFVSGESTFDQNSRVLLDYLLEIYEIQEVIDSTHFSKIFSKSQVFITKNMLMKFLSLLNGNSFMLELYGKVYSDVTFVKGNPRISYQLSLDEEVITVDYKGKDAVLPLTETGELLFYDGIIYQPDRKFIRNFKPFYNSLGKDKEPLLFKGESKTAFLEYVLPRISETMELDVPEELKSRYITCDLEAKIYFDKYKSGIKAELKYRYGEYEFNSFENASSGSFIVVRQRDKEDTIITQLLQLGFQPYKNFYILKDEDRIYEFLAGGVMDLEDIAGLYYSEDFRKLGIRTPGSFKAGVRMNTGLNMLELDMSFDEVPKEELKELLHSFHVKKKYYRLKNGSFVNLEDKTLSEVSHILNSLNVSSKNLDNDKLLLEKQHAVYLDKAFSDREFEFIRDRDFSALTEKILNPTVTDYPLPNGILAQLRPYQITGYKWLKTLADNELGGILADDMGLGKTLQSIVYIASEVTKVSDKEELEDKNELAEKDLKDDSFTNNISRKKDSKINDLINKDIQNEASYNSLLSSVKLQNKISKEDNIYNHRKQFLIVCPTSLIYNWLDELENFAPFIKAQVVSGTPQERQDSIETCDDCDVLITSYPLIRRDITLYEKFEFHTVFIDEAQFIKNDSSLNAKSVKRLRSKHKFALTGTPIENSLSELWSIFDFIMPGYLYNHSKFVEIYEKPIMKEDNEALKELHQHIAPFILRRMKKDVLTELPDKYETKMLTELSEEQKLVYMSYLESIRSELHSEIEENGLEKSKIRILAALTRLRQICCHPSTFIDNYQGGSGKLELLMEVITDAIANEHRILVFSQFTSMLRIIENELKDMNINYFYLEGSTPTEDRNDYVKRFNSGEGKVFLISLKAGGTGLNLTGADTVIHYDPWWNPAVEDQATDRVYRIGQQNKVHVMKLITKGTIEEKIYKLQRKKKELSDTIISSKEVFISSLTREELEELFTPMG
ncbi:SNF2 helicase associated domain-containing protein [Mobilitalea sibirica]|uniref:SNF2 helicase associated domain-containing protein n=1 Tax=Mobilitalea sibirica TaxID=1462919 RepID=A0A8J7H4H2_9FIRM|nr:DEAD/DEAH box helicase [Mobilitalea sibirica]MBH1942270.1 SNF2 helicase associated domain-containing protein [Mobilitalea sibirica]